MVKIGNTKIGNTTMTSRLRLTLAGLCCVLATVSPTPVVAGGRVQQETVIIRKAYPFVYQDINPNSATYREQLDLAEIYAERGVVLNFLASWCPPCWAEIPDLQKFGSESSAPLVFPASSTGKPNHAP